MPNRHERECGYELRRLHAPVREKLIERWRETQCDHEWWDCIYEDAKTIGVLMGIEVHNIEFSGFYSQGNGASFTGSYACVEGAVDAVKAHAPQDEVLHKIVEELSVMQATLVLQHGATFECRITRFNARYSHSYTMDVQDWGTEELQDCNDLTLVAREFRDLFRRFADWISAQLQAEYEYLTSAEQVIESIQASGLRFSSTGDTI